MLVTEGIKAGQVYSLYTEYISTNSRKKEIENSEQIANLMIKGRHKFVCLYLSYQ